MYEKNMGFQSASILGKFCATIAGNKALHPTSHSFLLMRLAETASEHPPHQTS